MYISIYLYIYISSYIYINLYIKISIRIIFKNINQIKKTYINI